MKRKSDVIFEIDLSGISCELKAKISELSRLACETDANWQSHCRYPSVATWENYVLASKAEDEYAAKILSECGSEK